jgi:protein-S-isoprenylcysteine O-methyltransferase Ste14
MTERRRRAIFATLLAVAVLGAAVFMASAVLTDAHWRVGIEVAGLGGCGLASGFLVALVRRWGAADDFWWPDSEH